MVVSQWGNGEQIALLNALKQFYPALLQGKITKNRAMICAYATLSRATLVFPSFSTA